MSAPDKRLWAKVSVDYFDNPKIEFLTDSAQLLHLQLILKAKAQGRGGMLAERACKVRGAAPFKELVDAGLLDRKGPQKWAIHDYEKHQTEPENLTENRASAGARGNHVRHHENKRVFDGACTHCKTAADKGEQWVTHPETVPK
ncbi:hypothetical protein [Arthrobacter woluwensis]|uniref:Uncharacterized protein n=1 Tax=Arthrobacter woluwensis TaxID=156980 RepID=A0A1H4WD25_9MICC|nr:hypothetical protein [Arthrobacter woluwensis]SEC53945.1 hypothetical protein SAMN04489745_3126 [Arthrobacter woluwensis]SEC90394.1 hypothetical protein SAMN04489745_3471 [Arthrobacter woluwensis]SEC95276.1 hypothetical protein SAMN04489745_3533 [Arthrobacter woluwensis]